MAYTWADDGFVLFRSAVPAGVNDRIVDAVAARRDNPRRYALHEVPDAFEIVTDPLVRDAVDAALGRRAKWDGLIHVHESGPKNGSWHRDNYWNPILERDVEFPPGVSGMLLYFPEDAPPEAGPTEICSRRGFDALAAGPAGICVLMRHDLRHRATANRTNRRRFMLKYLFAAGGNP